MSQNFNPFMQSGLSCLNSLDKSSSNRRGAWLDLFYYYYHVLQTFCFCIFNANSVDPDQASQSANVPLFGMLGINGYIMSV